jgi:redox-sensitive bicupin YhaK (pirin superfamily)
MVMKARSIERIIAPPAAHMVGNGFRVHNFIPGGGISMRRMSPFILLDYNAPVAFTPSETPRGVGVHPHKGFETVTIAYKGRVAHHDSSGGGGVIGEGEVQWMTAASGVLHKEYHEESFSREGGDFHMVQLWVNLPAKDKKSAPKYQAITKAAMPRHALASGLGEVEVIAGEFAGTKGGASTFTPLDLLNLRLRAGGEVTLHRPAIWHTALLVIEGSAQVNGQDVPADHFVLMAEDGTDFNVKASSDAVVLLMSGEPIDEPIAAYGPFVMNTHAEIQQAMDEFARGKYGVLAD